MLALQKFSFIVSLVVAREVSAITKPLSVQLQGSYTVIARAYHNIDQVKKQIKLIILNHTTVEQFHTLVYNKTACSAAKDIDVQEDMSCITSRQQHRSNPPYHTAKEYY